MLIRQAEIIALAGNAPANTSVLDVRIQNGKVETMGQLTPRQDEVVLDARGNSLLPGLQDHHVHFLSYAASLSSINCGPPGVSTPGELRLALAEAGGDKWIRGYGYHEHVAGKLDRKWLDQHGPDRPIRIQHRTGRMWIVNSLGLAQLQAAGQDLLPQEQRKLLERADGRLFEVDELIRQLLPGDLSMVETASNALASHGVTGFNDMTPTNSPETSSLFSTLKREGALNQQVCLSGNLALLEQASSAGQSAPEPLIGSGKIHLHEAALPTFDHLCEWIAAIHRMGYSVAIHCVTETELVFALASLRSAGSLPGDRIEHASITPPALLAQLQEMGLIVVTQPGFILERGDAYLQDIPRQEHDWLYRAKTFLEANIPVAFATDLPFSSANPWPAMQAAIQRVTLSGHSLGADEAVTPEFAVSAFLGSFATPTQPRQIKAGAIADLCLLDRPWQSARNNLAKVGIQATLVGGKVVHQFQNQ